MNPELGKIFKFSKSEEKILAVLNSTEGANVSDISKKSKVPRMTTYLALDSLKQRGLVLYTKKGKRRLWKKEADKDIASKLLKVSRLVSDNFDKQHIHHNKNTGFTIYRGLNSLFEIFERISNGNKNQRLLGIQPTKSMLNVVNKLSWKKLQPIQDAILKNKIIVEGLVREDYYPTLLSTAKNNKEREVIINSLIGRLTDMMFVSNEYLNADTELMMFGDVAFLVNWKSEVGIEIKNEDMLDFMKECFYLARGYGKKIDQNSYLRKLKEGLNNKI